MYEHMRKLNFQDHKKRLTLIFDDIDHSLSIFIQIMRYNDNILNIRSKSFFRMREYF